MRILKRLSLFSFLSSWLIPAAFAIDIQFEEVSAQAGLTYVGPSYGSSWGDFDSDGRPDLYVSNHFFPTALFWNAGAGVFVDATFMLEEPLDSLIDAHTGEWADFDNDGDRDLLFVVGAQTGVGTGSNRLLVNNGSTFSEEAMDLGLDLPLGRGRAPLWFDWNGDGRLDVLLANWTRSDGEAPTTLLTQTDNGFVDENALTGFVTTEGNLGAQLLPVAGENSMRLLIHSRRNFPDGVYDTTVFPFINEVATLGIPLQSATDDVVIADFDGDLEAEMYIARRTRPSAAVQTGPQEIRASLEGADSQTIGFSFAGGLSLSVEAGPRSNISEDSIFIGASGANPATLVFELNSTDPAVWNEYSLAVGDSGMLIYFDTDSARWRFVVVGSKRPRMIVIGASDFSDLQTEGFVHSDGAQLDALLDQRNGAFVNVASEAGLTTSRPCPSATSADFDNDMDLDIYLVCNDAARNLPNVLLENQGSGHFVAVLDAADAIGSTLGRGDTASTADYDSDGFIDILVTNGRGDTPLFKDGPTELFRNQGNANHWIQIELIGTNSNADGIGALAYVDAGSVRQVRARDGGMHRFSQNHGRLHFGLGGNERVDSIEIRWPSGIVQTLTDLNVDQILTITEVSPALDADADGVGDASDNCLVAANSQQTDTDEDGIGNACDPDIAQPNDCLVNFADLTLFGRAFFSNPGAPNWDPNADLTDDDLVGFDDLQVVRDLFFQAPGPSGQPSSCE